MDHCQIMGLYTQQNPAPLLHFTSTGLRPRRPSGDRVRSPFPLSRGTVRRATPAKARPAGVPSYPSRTREASPFNSVPAFRARTSPRTPPLAAFAHGSLLLRPGGQDRVAPPRKAQSFPRCLPIPAAGLTRPRACPARTSARSLFSNCWVPARYPASPWPAAGWPPRG